MIIRKYNPLDCKQLSELFYDTVHTVNARDYTEEQLNVWATGSVDLAEWNKTLSEHDTVVAAVGDKIVGFGDIDRTGYLDRLFIHKDYQGRGIATAICDRLEQAFGVSRVSTHSSITAKSFFEKRGYRVVREQKVEREGVYLTNYLMEK